MPSWSRLELSQIDWRQLMEDLRIRDAIASDRDAIVGLNAESEAVTSPMNSNRFDYLFRHTTICWVVEIGEDVVGFLMAMRDDSEYENENFTWFHDRLKKFVYIDRVVLEPKARGLGIGSMLYEDLQSWAVENQMHSIAAEMDLVPPNIGSLKFHREKGFVPFGRRELKSGKTISMQVCPIKG